MKISDVRDIPPATTIKVTSLKDGNPFKKTVTWYTSEKNDVYQNNGLDGIILSFETNQAGSYSPVEARTITTPTNEWLNNPRHMVEFLTDFDTVEHAKNYRNETVLAELVDRLFWVERKQHNSKYFRFDIDGMERTEKNFKFSEINKIKSKSGQRYDWGYEFSEEEIHRPIRLQIGKLTKPRTIDLINGNRVAITHITSVGELIYDIEKFKCVNRMFLAYEFSNAYRDMLWNAKIQDTIEDHLQGDVAEYRPGFLAAYETYINGAGKP
jgi:hypothetical protein